MKRKNYQLLSSLLVFAVFIFTANGLSGQNLVNTANGTITNAGVIRFVEAAGTFENAHTGVGPAGVALSNTSGTIEFNAAGNTFSGAQTHGANNAARIGGWLQYTGNVAQDINAGYHTNLGLITGTGAKSFNAVQVNVDGIYVGDANSTRNYGTSTFIYDGEGAGTEDQTIFGEWNAAGGSGVYANLAFWNDGIKTLASGDQCNATVSINLAIGTDAGGTAAVVTNLGELQANDACTVTQAVGAILNCDATGATGNDGTFETQNGAGTYDGATYLYSGGIFKAAATSAGVAQTFQGVATVVVGEDALAAASSGSFSVEATAADATSDVVFTGTSTLDLKNVNGVVSVSADNQIEFAGAFTFTNGVAYGTGVAERANMEFNVASTTLYSGTGQMTGTGSSYPYGNLTITNASNSQPEGANSSVNIFAAGNLDVSGSDVYMDSDSDPTTGTAGMGVLALLDPTKTVTIANDIEIRGGVRHYFGATYVGGTALIYNNAATSIAVTDNGANTDYITLSTYAATTPTATDYNAATDIQRRFAIDYNMTSGNWTGTIQAAYVDNPEDPFSNDDDKNSIRFRDYGTTAGAVSTKLSTGNAVNNNIAYDQSSAYAYASLAGITSNASASLTSAYLASGDEFLLRGGPTWFITINHGRWSNPNTWDEGVQPGPNDYCKVRHTVHAGYVRTTDNYTVDESTHLATFTGSPSTDEMGAYIWIYSGDEGGSGTDYEGTLMLGGIGSGAQTLDKDWGIRSVASLSISGITGGSGYSYAGASLETGSLASDQYIANAAKTLVTVSTPDITQTSDAGTNTLYVSGLLLFNGATFNIRSQYTNSGMLTNAGTVTVGE